MSKLDVPENEAPYQKQRRRLTTLFFVSLFLLSVALEIYNRAVDPRELFANIGRALSAMADPDVPIPAIDVVSNVLAIGAVMRNMLPGLVMLWLVQWLGARVMQAVHGMSSLQEARSFLSNSLFGKLIGGGPFIVISKGNVLGGTQQPPVRIGGPGVLIVYNDSAVLLEHAGRLTRVVGPGFHPLRRFEKIREIIDLRPRWYPLTVSGMSREGIPVRCTVDVHYQINDRGENAHQATREMPYAYSEEAAFKAATNRWVRESEGTDDLDWGALVVGGAEGTLRAIMARYPLDRLVQPLAELSGPKSEAEYSSPPPRYVIQEELEAELGKSAAQNGAKILEVALRNIEPEDPIAQQWIETWQAEWKKRVREELASARAERERQLARVKAEAEREMILAIADSLQKLSEEDVTVSSNVILLSFLESLERVLGGHQAFYLLPDTDRMVDQLQTLHGMIEGESQDSEGPE
jgi:regulator of protease activity HflC (stomatin/prohibitin superfamily)